MDVQDSPEGPTFHELRERIVARYSELTPQLQTIAQYALSDPDRMAIDTVATLAARLDVPGSSIVRFSQAMGYTGFTQMKKTLSANLIYRAQSSERSPDARPAALDQVIRGVADARRSLRALEQDVDAETFRHGAAALAAARTVFVTAQHRSYATAALFAWRSVEANRQCVFLDNVGGFALPQSRLAGPQDATLAISFSPYQPSVVQAAQAHRENGGAVVAVTDTPLSPLAPHATALFIVADGTSVAAAVLVEALAIAMVEHHESARATTNPSNESRTPHVQD